MKRIISILAILGIISIIFTGCIKDKCNLSTTFYKYDPIFLTLEEIRSDISMEESRELKNPGQIYYYENLIFINELDEGIHVLNNIDPANPVSIGFIVIKGNKDFAIRNNILYADNYIDLVALDISSIMNYQESADIPLVKRVEDIFQNYYILTENGFRVGWKKTEEYKEISCASSYYESSYFIKDESLFSSSTDVLAVNNLAPSTVGIGGSTARFTIAKDHLYTLGQRNVSVFSLEDAGVPDNIANVSTQWNLMETIFPYGDYIFLGANNGIYIYDNSEPANLHLQTEFTHATSCDPVYVENDIAFVTLNGNNICGGFRNELDIIDVSNISSPDLIKILPMTDPHGLTIFENTLYLCDGIDGLEVYPINTGSISQANFIGNRIEHITGFDATDAIMLPNNVLMVVSKEGIYQFNTEDRENLVELSVIHIAK